MFASLSSCFFHQFDENMEAPQSEEVTTRCNKCGVQCSKTAILRGAAYSVEWRIRPEINKFMHVSSRDEGKRCRTYDPLSSTAGKATFLASMVGCSAILMILPAMTHNDPTFFAVGLLHRQASVCHLARTGSVSDIVKNVEYISCVSVV